ELDVVGAYASGPEDFPAALTLAAQAPLAPLAGLVGARYPLTQWRQALDHALSAGRLGTTKVVFDTRATR
ncbi:MAG TPA: hypothetical protein VNE21_03160, partial [Mycobacteriales bacterium]|nr:hypothetical protein [Mycobacteriales bacterium]